MAEQWLSISEYARTFGVSDMTVRRRVKTGRLHAVLKEGKYFIPVQQTPTAGKRAGGEMQVIKGHPQAHKTFLSNEPRQASMPQMTREPEPQIQPQIRGDYLPPQQQHHHHHHDESDMVPQSLRRPLQATETSLVDTRALIAFCEATLRKVSEGERRTVEKFKSKLEALEATLVSKDMEIKSLRQQVEDLQLLVKILEKKKVV
jgi:hypothetical protein